MQAHERGLAKLRDLKPAPYNPRRIDDAAMKALSASLDRFGVVQEIVVNRRTGHIVGGHQRVAALRVAKAKEVPVVWVDLDDAEERALNVALNSPLLAGEFDEEALAAVLRDVHDALPLEYDDLRLDELISEPEAPADTKGDDETPEVTAGPADSKAGEVYQLGPHRLVCGDSTDPAVAALACQGKGADLFFTDPPYGVSYVSHKAEGGTASRFEAIENDDLNPAELETFLRKAFTAAALSLRPGAAAYVFHADQKPGIRPAFESAFVEHFRLAGTLVWVKPAGTMGWQDYRNQYGGSGSTLIAAASAGRRAALVELQPAYCDVIRRRWTRWARENGREPGPGSLE